MADSTSAASVDHSQLVRDLHELAPQWRIFGIYLGVPIDKLDGLHGETSMVDRCFTNILVMWLNEGASVEQLIKALKSPGVNHGRLAAEIERKHKLNEVKLELSYLLDELKDVKASWYFLGLFLGIKDGELDALQRERISPGVDQCFSDTLILWLKLKECNCNQETLIKAINNCGYGRLAGEMKSKYKGVTFVL